MAAVLRLQDHVPGSSLRPEEVVTLRLMPRQREVHPKIEVHRVRSEDSSIESEGKGWDAVARLPEAA
jgi:hypothetical protein